MAVADGPVWQVASAVSEHDFVLCAARRPEAALLAAASLDIGDDDEIDDIQLVGAPLFQDQVYAEYDMAGHCQDHETVVVDVWPMELGGYGVIATHSRHEQGQEEVVRWVESRHDDLEVAFGGARVLVAKARTLMHGRMREAAALL